MFIMSHIPVNHVKAKLPDSLVTAIQDHLFKPVDKVLHELDNSLTISLKQKLPDALYTAFQSTLQDQLPHGLSLNMAIKRQLPATLEKVLKGILDNPLTTTAVGNLQDLVESALS